MSTPSVFQLSIGARILTSRSVIWLESGSAGGWARWTWAGWAPLALTDQVESPEHRIAQCDALDRGVGTAVEL